ncbi:MAG: porin family protein [Sulfurovum sp.]|nr:porin family protein [Sulfurovum sp.]
MKKMLLSAIVLSAAAMAGGDIVPVEPMVETPIVVSERNFYVGVGIAAVSTRNAAVSMDIFSVKNGQDRLGNVTLQAGYNFNSYITLEGRYTTTFVKEDIVKMSGWSFFVKPQYPITEKISLYALLGYGSVDISGTNGGVVDVDDSGFQWGLGASYALNEQFELFFDYTSLANDMDGIYGSGIPQADADAFTMGVTYNF